jgi:hypothetical protein
MDDHERKARVAAIAAYVDRQRLSRDLQSPFQGGGLVDHPLFEGMGRSNPQSEGGHGLVRLVRIIRGDTVAETIDRENDHEA